MCTGSRLPNADAAYVPPEKVTSYLLSLSHPVGRSKARFFHGLGFDHHNALLLQLELGRLAREGEVVQTIPGEYGSKYIVEGKIGTPSGVQASLRTVWLIETGEARPRLVTAYPQDE